MRALLIWAAVFCAMALPLAVAVGSPLLQWRQPVYIVAGFAGILGLCALLLQPLLVVGRLPGLTGPPGRRAHRWLGATLILAIVLHVGGLWLTSPPDVVDALLFASPTPFSVWGVLAMWAAFAAAGLAILRKRLRPRVWRLGHSGLIVIVVAGTIVHALLIEGTMGTLSKVALCGLVALATLRAITDRRVWVLLKRRPR